MTGYEKQDWISYGKVYAKLARLEINKRLNKRHTLKSETPTNSYFTNFSFLFSKCVKVSKINEKFW